MCKKGLLLRNLWKWPQTVGSFITSNSELLTSSFSEKSSKTPRRLLLYCILLLPKKSCHLPNKNVVSGLHQRPPLLDSRKERKSKAWVEFVCLRIPLTIVFDASLNYVSRPPCPNGSLAWLPFHHYMHCSSKRILKKERPLRTWERKWERVPYLNSNVDLQTDDERQRKREQDQTFNSQPTVKLLQIIRP